MGDEVVGSLQWEGEGGELIEAHLDGLRLVFEMMPRDVFEGGLKKTFCLQFIDPYGDTTFNQLQIPVLISELKSLLKTGHCQEHENFRNSRG